MFLCYNTIRLINLKTLVFLIFIFGSAGFAQLSGSKSIPGDYATIADAVTALNSGGVGAGGVTFNVAAGHTESISSAITITATGTSGNAIVFQKSGAGANPLITRTDAGSNTTSTLGGMGDPIIQMSGTDYITFDGIDLTASNQGVEYGYLTHKPSGTDGCQNVTIKNCVVTMTKGTSAYVAGIYIGNGASSVSSATGVSVTSNAGRNTFITLIGNTIQNVHAGIICRGNTNIYDSSYTFGQSGSGNTIQNFGGGSATTTYGIYFIYVADPSVSYNTINNAGGGGSNHASTLYGVFYSTVKGNVVGSNNTITLANSSASSATYGLYSLNTATSEEYNNNVFSAGTLSSTGTIGLLYVSNSTTNKTVSGNSTSGTINRTGASGTFYCYYNNGGPTSGTENIYNNTFDSVSLAGTSTFYGILSTTNAAHTHNIYNNTISDISGGSGIKYGIHRTLASGSIYSNTIANISGTGTVYGISCGSGTNYLYKNNIYGLSSSSTGTTAGTVTGIVVATTGSTYIYNNFISDLNASTCASTDAVRGIGITNTSGTTAGIYYNSIYLNASSTGANFGSSGVYHTYSASSLSVLDLRNNVIVNKSTPAGTGLTVALRRNAATNLNNYSTNSNNNLFYAGTAGSTRLLYYDGTNSDQTMETFKTRVSPREGSSFAENAPFINSSTTPYNLHINTSTATQIESGGAAISSPIAISDDYDGNSRHASTPDVGADEGSFTGLDLIGPTISYTTLANTSSTSNRAFSSVTISDASGVNTTSGNRPRVYYKKSTHANTVDDNTSSTDGWKWVEANGTSSPFDFTINYSLLYGGSVTVGDSIQYFVVAEDLSGPTVSINSGTFASTPSSVDLTVDQFPLTGTINSYAILASISGTKTVGTGGDYSTLTAAVTDLNAKELTGAVVFSLTDATYSAETLPIVINVNPGSSATNTITIKPAIGVTPTITGASASSVIKIYGADYVNINGSNAADAAALSIINTSTATNTAAIWVTSLGSGAGSTNVTVQNCSLACGSSTITNFGVFVGGMSISTSGTGADNDNLTIQNNVITGVSHGIYVYGTASSSSGANDNVTISGNTITINTTTVTSNYGMKLGNCITSSVSQNTVSVYSTASNAPVGISLETGFLNNSVSRNKITQVATTATNGYGGRGITVGTSFSSSSLVISNNVIYGVTGSNYSSFGNSSSMGIAIGIIGNSSTLTTTTGGVELYYNSVNMYGDHSYTGATITTALYVGSGASSLTIKNNIFRNALNNTTTSGSKNYCIYSAVANTAFTSINYNEYYPVSSTNSTGYVGYLTSDRSSLSDWQTASGQDANSLNSDPSFNSNTNLMPNLGSPVLAAGTPVGSVTIDFTGASRSGSTPSIGAYESGADGAGPDITYTALTRNSSTSTRALSSFATMTDVSGVNTTSGTNPRLYYKKSTEDNTYIGNTSSDNGWKYVEASNASSPFSFTIDYSKVFGGSVTAGDAIQYFVVAQDLNSTPNVGINSGTFTTTPSSVNLNAAHFPLTGTINSYLIAAAFSGTHTVGTPSETNYSSFTGAGGFFEAINNGVLTGNVTVTVNTDVTEDGTNALNELVSEGGSFTLTIQPNAASERVISGAVANGMIRLNGADNVTIDGRYSGSGSYLRFRNTNNANPTITLLADASSNTIRNCYIEGGNTGSTSGVLVFSTGTTTGNDNNTVTNCTIRDRSDVTQIPANLIYSQGSSTSVRNSGNTLSDNSIFNFFNAGVFLATTNSGNENWTISGNTIYQEAQRSTVLYGMQLNTLGANNTVTQNIVRDLNTGSTLYCIYIGSVGTMQVTRNRIYSIPSISGSASSISGIYLNGGTSALVSVVNNQISLIPTFNNAQVVYGIYDWQNSSDKAFIYYNSVFIGGAGSSKSYAFRKAAATNTTYLRNNAFVNHRQGGTVGHFTCGMSSATSDTNIIADNNFYSGLGPVGGNELKHFEMSTTAKTFSEWKSSLSSRPFGKDRHTYGIISTDVNWANLFTDTTTGNLNVVTTNTECWYLNGKGAPIVFQSDDYGATSVRSSTITGGRTDIGSDEFSTLTLPPGATASGSPAPSTATSYTASNRTLGSLNWGSGGTPPTSMTFTYNSGSVPPGSLVGNYASSYWTIENTGGSGFSYDITINYDENEIGSIADESKIRLVKSSDNGTTWTAYLTQGSGAGQYSIDTSENTITVYGLGSFSVFSLTDNDNPLPVELSSFTSSVSKRDVTLNWETKTEVNTYLFEIERRKTNETTAEEKWEKIGSVDASGNSNSAKEYAYLDKKLNSGKYQYRLKMIDNDGTFIYSETVNAEISLPTEYRMSQNYPNPFNPTTNIDYQLPYDSEVMLELYSVTGERVARLVNEIQPAGYYTYTVKAHDSQLNLASGVYIYRMAGRNIAGGNQFVQVKKMMLVK